MSRKRYRECKYLLVPWPVSFDDLPNPCATVLFVVSGKFVGNAKIMGDRLPLSENPKLRNNSERIGKFLMTLQRGGHVSTSG